MAMTDQWEKYVEQAAEAGWESIRPTYWVDAKDDGMYEAVPCWAEADEADKESYRKIVRAELAVVGPLIAEDTRERLVAAAARAVEREQAPVENPFDALRSTLAFSSNDWGSARDFAWLYGVVLGWGFGEEDAHGELAARFDWPPETIDRLRRLHAAFNAAEIAWSSQTAARP
jgi:hypothetical protein